MIRLCATLSAVILLIGAPRRIPRMSKLLNQYRGQGSGRPMR